MESNEAIAQLRARTDQVSRSITEMHPLVPHLGNAAAQNEIYRALFELTKQVEVVKKNLLRIEKQDESKLL